MGSLVDAYLLLSGRKDGDVFLGDVSSIRWLGETSARFPECRWQGGILRDARRCQEGFLVVLTLVTLLRVAVLLADL